MNEKNLLDKARQLIDEDNKKQALNILRRLYKSKNLRIKLDAILSLLIVLDRLYDNKKLLKTIDEGLRIASIIGKNDVVAYLFIEKINFLINKLSFLTYRKKNLKLAENVFKWFNFSTEREKIEFETIGKEEKETWVEIDKIIETVLGIVKKTNDYYFCGNIFLRLGEFYGSKFLDDKLNLMKAGKIGSKIGNIYFIRRWKLDNIFFYNKNNRKIINENKKQCVKYFNLAILNFRNGKHELNLAYAYYNLSINYNTFFEFIKAKKNVRIAEKIVIKSNDKRLLNQIILFKKQLRDKNKHTRNYVEEMGLNLP